MSEAKENKNLKNPYQDTLNLPKTDFSIRANSQQKEPELLQRWEADGLAQQATEKNRGNQKFILHDGPPYANGHLHLGHALTYVLKDIVCKAKRMSGYYAPLVPGWDCHGLPVEQKVMADLGLEKKMAGIDRVTFKKHCRDYANNWIAVQAKELKELGKLADYEHPYITMSSSYEASVLEALATFVEQGHIERKLKTVPWCGECKTVLATAEIEYKDRKDPSIYVLFTLSSATARETFPFLVEQRPNLSLSLTVWTTTPWTLPLNRAVGLNPSITYVVLQGANDNQGIIVAKDLADAVCAKLGIARVDLAEADAIAFEGKQVAHPFIENFNVPIILDESVQVGEGTACLHTAPGCGPEDYLLGLRHGLEIFSPVSAEGRYVMGIEPASLEGKSVREGQKLVLEMMTQKGTLLHQGEIEHSYPHCWRCHKGLIFRATSQWFCDLQKNDLVPRALAAIESMTFVPARGQARLHAFIANRTEWCISRQRQWGVPLPAVLCDKCGWAFMDASMIRAVAKHVAHDGIEFWDRMTMDLLRQEAILPHGFGCKGCGNDDFATFTLERDILDVWFESGVSSFAVLAKDPERLGVPADLYFEGSDQHRGWFQSSLLCGMMLYGHTPTKGIATHGFIVDENHRKMSKSLGNVIAPNDIMTKYSRDILRTWVGSVDYEDDLVISERLLGNVTEMYRKIRNTCRYLLSNLHDFDIAKDAVEIDQMWALDQYALATLYDLNKTVREGYDQYHFSAVVNALNTYCTATLSAVYLDILKDRLYVEKADSVARRSAQTAMYHILDVMTRLMAPILSFLAEEISDHYQRSKTASIHLQDFTEPVDVWEFLALQQAHHQPGLLEVVTRQASPDPSYAMFKRGQWLMLEQLRDAVLKSIEVKREQGVVKHPYEAAVTLHLDPQSQEYALFHALETEMKGKENFNRFVRDWFIVSSVTIAQTPKGLEASLLPWLHVAVERAAGVKCPRCWQWSASSQADGLCARCQSVLKA